MVTLMVVPAGITMGGASCFGAAAAWAAGLALFAAAGLLPDCDEPHPHEKRAIRQIHGKTLARDIYFVTSEKVLG